MSRALILEAVGRVWPNGAVALRHVSFEAEEGTITALIGPSGAGKTTLLRLIANLDQPESGQIVNSFGPPGLCFSEPSLWPHRTLLDNVSLPLKIVRKMSGEEAESKARAILYEWGLGNRLYAYPAELSQGQQQRGALARTAVMEPKIICLDEVTSSLDPELSAVVMKSVLRWRHQGAVIIAATHQSDLLRTAADQIIFLEAGGVVEQGPSSDVLRSRNPRTRAFLSTFPPAFAGDCN